jgi:peptidoglycan/xylan/chitin deacetylase (PgdA/CDA1 family)
MIIHVTKPQHWLEAFIHLWGDSRDDCHSSWPGIRMSLEKAGTSSYIVELPSQRSAKFVLNGGNNDCQTEDFFFEGEECWFHNEELWSCSPDTDKGFRFKDGFNKAVVLSYDDGSICDERLIAILDKYGIKGTFHVNSRLTEDPGKVPAKRLAEVYAGHEVSVHSATHPFLYHATRRDLRREIWADKKRLECLTGKPISGLSYPFGSYNLELLTLMPKWGLEYGRVVPQTNGFRLPGDLLRWRGTCHHRDGERFVQEFLAYNDDKPALFFMWGHSWEFDSNAPNNNWDYIENLCARLGKQQGVWYATAAEVASCLLAHRKNKGHGQRPIGVQSP